jgi:hypothetical protein
MTVKHKPSDSPLDKRTVEELELQEKLTLKYIDEGFTREEAGIRAVAEMREKQQPS